MKSRFQAMKSTASESGRRSMATIASLLLVLAAAGASGQASSAPSPCAGAAWHAFDFWLGDWDVYDAQSGKREAHARIVSVSGGCALREIYEGVDGDGGESLTSWDAAHRVWRQYWTSRSGQIVALEGGLKDAVMILAGPEEGTHAPDLVRGVWKPEANGVRETAARSIDSGRTWRPWFDLKFQRAAPAR
jgi:hypothetical protein